MTTNNRDAGFLRDTLQVLAKRQEFTANLSEDYLSSILIQTTVSRRLK